MALSYTEEQLAALMSALSKGERSVKFADREVVYRSIEELERAIAIIKSERSTGTSRFSFAGFDRG